MSRRLARTLGAVILLLGCRAGTTPAAPAEPVPAHTTLMVDSRVLEERRVVNVYTPPGYDASAERYPVLYVPDGGLTEDFPHVASDIDAAIRAGEMQAVIVVGIENTERRRDMTGPTAVEEDRKIAPRVGGSASFRAFLRDELRPEVNRRFRSNGHNAIVGESLAGLFVLETLFNTPEMFDIYIALSPSLWWNDQGLLRGAGAWLNALPGMRATLYFATAGDDDIDGAGAALAEVLRAHAPPGLTWSYVPRPDLQHSTIYRGASPGVFRKLFAPAP